MVVARLHGHNLRQGVPGDGSGDLLPKHRRHAAHDAHLLVPARGGHAPASEGPARRRHAVLRAAGGVVVLHLHEAQDLLLRQVVAMRLPDLTLHFRQLILGDAVRQEVGGLLLGSRKVAFVGKVGEDYKHREKEEGHQTLPDLHNVRREPQQDDQEPKVSEHGETRGDHVHRHLPDGAHFGRRDCRDADRGDAEQVEGRAAHDRGGAQVPAEEAVSEELDDAQEDLRRARAQSHEREVGHRGVPDQHRNHSVRLRVDLLLLLRGDALDGPHEHVGDDRNSHKTPEEAYQVEEPAQAPGPFLLIVAEERQKESATSDLADRRPAHPRPPPL
mmetsp:Transcript_89039/g.252349  ORF Transcript_89039/g.252349 Transcript_89039/m.252349 type:complete len:330 (-) Transcript_89039:73-1062(-)